MNRLQVIIETYEKKKLHPFKPTREFFKSIEIGHRRFYQLVRNEVSLTFSEMQRLSEYFNVGIWELHDSTMTNPPKNIQEANQ